MLSSRVATLSSPRPTPPPAAPTLTFRAAGYRLDFHFICESISCELKRNENQSRIRFMLVCVGRSCRPLSVRWLSNTFRIPFMHFAISEIGNRDAASEVRAARRDVFYWGDR